MIDVIRAGLLTTVQDLGRHGYRHLGVAMSGALDRLSLEVGNRLVGNRPDAACLEITFGPTVLRFLRATRIAITGTEFGATLDGKPVYSWWSLPVQAGQELTLQAAKRGMRGYVCIAGGIDVLPMLGSRSTDLAGQFGGLGGRALRDGDRLPVGAPAPRAGFGFSPQAPEFGVKAPAWCKFVLVHEPLRRGRHPSGVPWAAPIRVLPGSEYDQFPASAQEAFWSDEWLVTPNSNRMGYRLAGTELKRTAQDRPAVARGDAGHDPGAAEWPADRAVERRADHRRLSEDRRGDPGRSVEARPGAPERRDPLYPDDASRGASGFTRRTGVSAADRRRDRDA